MADCRLGVAPTRRTADEISPRQAVRRDQDVKTCAKLHELTVAVAPGGTKDRAIPTVARRSRRMPGAVSTFPARPADPPADTWHDTRGATDTWHNTSDLVGWPTPDPVGHVVQQHVANPIGALVNVMFRRTHTRRSVAVPSAPFISLDLAMWMMVLEYGDFYGVYPTLDTPVMRIRHPLIVSGPREAARTRPATRVLSLSHGKSYQPRQHGATADPART